MLQCQCQAGKAPGLAAASSLARSLEGLFSAGPTDPATVFGASTALVAAATLACFLPARRATRAEPGATLRG